ncbi:MAG: hypothetical protein NTV04_20195 [Deltaproteobacteria bacterium]|nr:hypothetical protein [Deltaproteobacteria bacterium]
MSKNNLESLYIQAQQAFQAKDFDRATNLLTQILVIDENYKDTSRLLARIVKEKRRRWYNDPRIWGSLVGLIVVGLLIWFVPKLPLKALFAPSAEISSATPNTIPTKASTPTIPPTAIPLAWNRISMGQEFATDTVTGIAVDKNDPDVIYVGMKNAGVFKSIDVGLSWSPRYQGLANTHVESLTIDPLNPKILYAGTLGGIFQTQDGGENWERIGEGYRLLMDPQNSSHLYADTGGGEVYESTDQGVTWETHENSCPRLWTWAIDPQDGMTLFGSENGNDPPCSKMGLYQSSDGGRTWNFLGLDGQWIGSLAVGVDEQGNVLIYAYTQEQGDLFSNDGGKSWSILETPGCNFLPVESDSPDIVYCADQSSDVNIITAGKFSRTLTISGPSNLMVDTFLADNYQGTPRLIAGAQGLYISTDDGQSWSNRSGGLGAARLELKIDPANNERMYLASYFGADEQDCELFRSDDSGKSWKQIMQGGHVSWCGPVFDSTNTIYLLKEGILERSTDNGDTWTSSSLPSGVSFGSVSANPYLAGFLNAGSNELFYSTDDGNSWQKGPYINNNFYNSRFYYAKGGNLIYSNNLSFSTDGGRSWNSCSDAGRWTTRSDSQLVIDPGNDRHLYLATKVNGIVISDDGCQSWQPSNYGLGDLFVNSVALDPNNPNTIYAGTNGGAYVSYDGGQTWGQINDGLLGVVMVYSIGIDSQSNVYAATPYGLFKLEKK